MYYGSRRELIDRWQRWQLETAHATLIILINCKHLFNTIMYA